MHGELAKLGISISQAAVSKYMVRHRTPPSHTWRSFLDNHANDLVSLDFFTLPTATFRVLFVFIVLRHDRRRIVHFNVTEHPSAEWTAQQMVDAFPWDTAPRYLVRDHLYLGIQLELRVLLATHERDLTQTTGRNLFVILIIFLLEMVS